MDEHRGVEVQELLVAAGMVTVVLVKDEVGVRFVILDDEEAGAADLLLIAGGKRQGWLVAVHGSNLLENSNYYFNHLSSGGQAENSKKFHAVLKKVDLRPETILGEIKKSEIESTLRKTDMLPLIFQDFPAPSKPGSYRIR